MDPEPLSDQPPRVLILDASSEVHDLAKVRLKRQSVQLLHAREEKAGLALIRRENPDAIVLAYNLPGRGGAALCQELCANASPILMLVDPEDSEMKVAAFDAGAFDCVGKPFDAIELRMRLRSALRLKRYHDLLAARAHVDGLTGLWSRSFFDTRLKEEVSVARRNGQPMSLVLIDVDHFRAVNDRCGRPAGDDILRRVAKLVESGLRSGDAACRFEGGELALILRDANAHGARTTAERIRAAVEKLEFTYGGARVGVTVSLGCASDRPMRDRRRFTPAELVAAAGKGLALAKNKGFNCVATGDAI